MADIELVIKIPEELKNEIDNANEDNYRTYIRWFETTLYCAIKNGTPLPKGHGRLIDADVLNRKDVNCANVPMNFIDTAPTIIEADKAESEIHCNCTDEEIAKSFIKDVEAVKDLLNQNLEDAIDCS